MVTVVGGEVVREGSETRAIFAASGSQRRRGNLINSAINSIISLLDV